MTEHHQVRAWKDPDFLGDRSDHPAGEIVLDHGAGDYLPLDTEYLVTMGCCKGVTTDTCGAFSWGCCSQLINC